MTKKKTQTKKKPKLFAIPHAEKPVKACKACDDPDHHIRHTCGLKDLQKLLRF